MVFLPCRGLDMVKDIYGTEVLVQLAGGKFISRVYFADKPDKFRDSDHLGMFTVF